MGHIVLKHRVRRKERCLKEGCVKEAEDAWEEKGKKILARHKARSSEL